MNTYPASTLLTILLTALTVAAVAPVQAGPISYQGQLLSNDDSFNGTVGLEFRLFDQLSGGSQVGPVVSRPNWPVQDGLFQVDLDFGAGAFVGGNRFLEVRVNGTALAPRQAIRAVPVALHALNGGGSSPWTVDGSGAVEYLFSGQRFRFQPVTGTSEISPNVIIGHAANSVSGHGSAVLSGGSQNVSNSVQGNYSVISGGRLNQINGNSVTVSGGSGHTAQGVETTVGGGAQNETSGTGTTVAGGRLNTVSGFYSMIGGGLFNSASADYATIGGGYSNEASGRGSTVSGGGDLDAANIASGDFSVVGGGRENLAAAEGATVAGGVGNQAILDSATVGGGNNNSASDFSATIAGGSFNVAAGNAASIGGGAHNHASRDMATIGGGFQNTASHLYSTISGGRSNCAGGAYSWAGGRRAKVRPGFGSGSVGSGCSGVALNVDVDWGDQGTFVWADSQNSDFVSSGENQFLVRAMGGVGFGRAPSDYFVIDSDRLVQDDDYSFGTGALRILMREANGSITTKFRVMGNGGTAIGNSYSNTGVPANGLRVFGDARFDNNSRIFGNLRVEGQIEAWNIGTFGQWDLCHTNAGQISRCASSARYKDEVRELEAGASLIAALRPVRFRWIDNDRQDIGLIAEEVAEVIPELVEYDDDGDVQGVNFRHLSAVLIAAVQESQAENKLLRDELADVQSRLEALEILLESAGFSP